MDYNAHIFSHDQFRDMQQNYLDNPQDFPAVQVFTGSYLAWATLLSDWLSDYGCDHHKIWEVVEPPTISQYLPTDYYGRGSGRGSGIGRGRGRGRGSGSGSGIGSGRRTIMENGKAYLVITVDWFAWVGRVVRQVGPWEYEMESLSKISETHNGDNWQDLCAGDKAARKACTYQHYKVKGLLGLGAVAKLEWKGQTPQEAGL